MATPRGRWRALIDRFLPEYAASDPEIERRARIVIGLAFVCIPLGVVYAVRLQWLLDESIRTPLSLLMLGLSPICGLALALLRRGAPLPLAVHLVLGYVLVIGAVLGYFLGGVRGPLPYWLVIVPAISAFAGSLRSAFACFAACQVIYAGFAWLTWQGHEFGHMPRPLLVQVWLGSVCGLIATSLALVLAFDRTKEEALRVLGLMNHALLRARDQAHAASQSKSAFLARVSQDLRTPMADILGGVDLLTARVERDDISAGPVETIGRNTRRLLETIDKVVDLSQTEGEHFVIDEVECDPRAVLGEVLELLRTEAAARAVPMRADCAEDLPSRIVADPARLRQILLSLAGNAIKFSAGGEVLVRAQPVAGQPRIRFEIVDTGLGIEPETLPRIFEPFQQADASSARRFGGSGLGLAIARRLCERMGGEIVAESELGHGSTFRVELPVRGTAGARAAHSAGAAPASSGLDAATGTPVGLWERLTRRIVPVGLEDDPRALHHARVVLALAVAPTPVLIPWAIVLALILEPPVGQVFGALLLLTAPLLWAVPLLFRSTGSMQLAGNVLATHFFATLSALSYCIGGAASPSTYWLLMISAAAPVLGIRAGALWSALGLVVCAGLYALERMGFTPHNWLAPELEAMVCIASAATLNALATAMMLLYERTHAAAIQQLAHSNEELAGARQTAERASQGKSDFLANMSHELRTPMTAILGYAELLVEGWSDEQPDLRRTARLIQRNTLQLLSLVDDLMDLNRLHEGRIDLERVAFGPEELARSAADLLRDRAVTKALELSVRVEPGVPERVQGDPTRVRQVLVNLIGNAIKFTNTGSVEIRVRAADGCIRYEIEDTGRGLSAEQQQSLLRPPSDEAGTSAAPAPGSGLGLMVSRLLCELMGGELGVWSTSGAGSCFYIQIPAAPAPALRSPTPESATSAAPVRLRSHVLLVEDSPDTRTLIAHLLRKAGALVIVAGDGQEGLDQIDAATVRGEPFALVLMDLQMPVLDGYGAVRELRRRGSTLPVVALTAHALEEERLRCLEAGFDAFATKPIDRRTLLGLVQEWSAEEKTGAPSPGGLTAS